MSVSSPTTIEEWVKAFTLRLLQLSEEDGKTEMPIKEAVRFAEEMQKTLDAQKKKE